MLSWLDADEDAAAGKYEAIRQKLIKLFELRGCSQAEDLADITFDRVSAKIEALAATYQGNPAAYFYGVARNVILESRRNPRFVGIPEAILSLPAETAEKNEKSIDCLRLCLSRLTPQHRSLIVQYYSFEKGEKAQTRLALANRLDLSIDTLRTKACRIRTALQNCAFQCLER